MTRRLLSIALFAAAIMFVAHAADADAKPNIVVILADDMGYGDLGCYGYPTIATPELDRLAAQGMKFTQFYTASSVCTPSRAAFLTGRYAIRSGLTEVLITSSTGGMPADEITLAEALRDAGYATACVGKWHLGWQREFLPLNHGFDTYFGMPYANDMSPTTQPTNPTFKDAPPLPIIRDFTVTNTTEPDQRTLTKQYTEESLNFIRKNAGKKPFFLYLAHTFPHVPLYASKEFEGRSRRGLYGDTVEEIDWSTAQVMAALREAGIEKNTLVVFFSDNGPWVTRKTEGGSGGPFRDGKVSTWEGGFRSPGIFYWPSKIPAGVTTAAFGTAMDLFTTCIKLGGGNVPTDRPIDGVDLSPVLFENKPGREPLLFYYFGDQVQAVRKGPWKAHLKTIDTANSKRWGDWTVQEHNPPLLFNVETDPGENVNLAAKNPDVVASLIKLIDEHRAAMKPGNPQR